MKQTRAMCQAVRFLEKTLTTHYDQWMNYFDFWPAAYFGRVQVTSHKGLEG
jgi:predicted LPLAT superfamily acyltransferase